MDENKVLRENITKDYKAMAPTIKEQALGYQRGLEYLNAKQKDLPTLAHVIKEIAVTRRASSRRLAEIIYHEKNPKHGVQYFGRDLKRWAAIALEELFRDGAFISEKDGGFNEYWHE
jgi:16S rRNA C967 or C1407 C5-methylase (RsmB/RsmF family)